MQNALLRDAPVFQDRERNLHAFAPLASSFAWQASEPENVSHFSVLRSVERETSPPCKIDESIAYMAGHLSQPLQVSALATMVNISPSHYFALFKRRTGFAPIEYFTRLRMNEARRLLDTTDSSVKEVAAALGYDDPFYFSRVFKSVNQLAPSNYRLKRREAACAGENSPCES